MYFQLSTDLMIQYQSGYSNVDETKKSAESTYHDPLTKTTYVWDSNKNSWTPKTTQYNYPDNYKYTDPNSGSTYVWKAQEQSWSVVKSDESEKSKQDINKSTPNTSESQGTPNVSSNSNQGKYVHAVLFFKSELLYLLNFLIF